MIRAMIPLFRSLRRSPRFLLGAIVFLGTLLAQSGELGTSDTMHRLQTTHSFWTHEPAVFPNEYPEFGLVGRGGSLYSWYGMGQSLVMLPADLAGSWLEELPIFAEYNGNDPSVRAIFVSVTTNLLLAVMTALVTYRLLLQLGFTVGEAAAGVLTLCFATTHLHYSQNMSENNLILLLTLAGISFQYQWLRTGSRSALLVGGSAFGLNLLTRLTTGIDLLAAAAFLLMALLLECSGTRAIAARARQYVSVAGPVYAGFLLIDRTYQYYRFGSFFNTYMSVMAAQQRVLDPALPAAFPFEGRFLDGFLGPLFAPEKSVFLFDPLLILAFVTTVLFWRRLEAATKAFALTGWLLLFAYIAFYAKYTVWSGEFAWGDRFVSSAAEMIALLAVPLVLRYRRHCGAWLCAFSVALVSISVAIQFASLCFWLPLEIYQMETLGHPTLVIGLRFKNIVAFALGKMEAWGLTNNAMREDAWDYVHITTWNFLPFLLRRVGAAPGWLVNLMMTVWAFGIAAVAWLAWQLRRAFCGNAKTKQTLETETH